MRKVGSDFDTDGSSLGDLGRASGGGVIQDHRGLWIIGFTRSIGLTTGVDAERWALRDCYDHLDHDYHHVYRGELWCFCCNKLNKEDKFGFSSRKNQTSQLANLLHNILIEFLLI